jgi:tRNA A-37 threonylcarbamoyl transferase component Bud32
MTSRTGWFLDESLGPEARKMFADIDSSFAVRGDKISKDGLCWVELIEADGKRYYVKRYRRGGEGLAEFVGASKAYMEQRNLRFFSDWGLAAAKVVAYGQEPFWKIPRRGMLVTAEIPNTTDLATLVEKQPQIFRQRAWLKRVVTQVARAAAIMHQHKFAHNDFKWRNILVDSAEEPNIFLIDCPSGRCWWEPFFNYRRIKDIACLDKVALKILTRTQRLHFYKAYKGVERLTASDKKEIKRILSFFSGRD